MLRRSLHRSRGGSELERLRIRGPSTNLGAVLKSLVGVPLTWSRWAYDSGSSSEPSLVDTVVSSVDSRSMSTSRGGTGGVRPRCGPQDTGPTGRSGSAPLVNRSSSTVATVKVRVKIVVTGD